MDGSVIEDLTVWNVKGAHYAVLLAYTQHVVVRNARLVGSGDRGQVGIGGNMFTGSVTIEGGSIVGFADGIQVPSRGRNAVRNTVLANNTDLVIGTANYRDRYVHLDNPVFRNASDPRHVNIRMNDLEVPHNGDMAMIFLDDRIDLTDGRGNNQRVFFPSQHPDSVPFPTDGVDALRGLSSEDIQRRFSIAPGGALAPPAATVLPRSNALAVAAAPFSQPAQAFAPERRAGEGYSLQFDHFSRAAAETLASGWTVAGSSADASPAALIFVDKTAPKFMLLNCLVPPQIHPDDVPFGYRVMGMVIDKV